MVNRFPQAILFDLDDTLLMDSNNVDGCWLGACQRCIAPEEGVTPESVLAAIQTYRAWFWSDPERHRLGRLDLEASRRAIVAGALLRLGLEQPTLAGEIALAYGELREAGAQLFPGALETLQFLRERGVRLALITNGSARLQRRKVEKYHLAPFFDCVLIEGEFGVGKPDERVYLHALGQLETSPAGAWMVGDNLEWEVAAPQRLGIFAIWHDVLGAGVPATSQVRPDRIIRGLAELTRD
jgi:putative hydrolase of the HAD superfamily